MAEVLPIRPRADTGQPEPPEAPASLSGEAAQLWENIVAEWVIGADALPLLVLGLEAWDRYREASEILREEGPVLTSKSGTVKQHPAHAVCRDNLNAVRQCFRQLRLEPPFEAES